MKDFPWWILPMFVTLIWSMVKLYKAMLRLCFGDEIDYEALNRKTDQRIAENLMAIKIEQQKCRLKADELRAMLEPEIQCQGCGYFHNVRRCPKCTRMAVSLPRALNIISVPKDSPPPQWVCAGSANITQAIANVREPMFFDRNVTLLGMSPEQLSNFRKRLTA